MARKLFLTILLILLLVCTGWFFFTGKSVPPVGSNSNTKKSEELKSLADHFREETPFNVLLMGYGGGTHEGTYLTDSMLVAHVDPGAKTTTLISLPRDLWVKIPTKGQEGGFWKINAAYALGVDDRGYPNKAEEFKGRVGGGNLAKFVVEQVTGLPIARFLALDFNGFKKTIDFLGGIDVKVEKTFDDFEYPVDGSETDLCGRRPEELPDLLKIASVSAVRAFPCRYERLHFDAGVVRMDGATALKFVRSRHSIQDGSDFGRSIRQKNVILAIKEKVLSLGFVPKIPGFITTLSSSLSADINALDIKDLIPQATAVGDYKINSLAISTDNFLKVGFSPDGQYILTSKDGVGQWASFQAGIRAFLDPESRLTMPIIQIVNGTGLASLSEISAGSLRANGLNVLTFGTYSGKRGLENTEITVFNQKIESKVLRRVQNVFETSNLKYKEPNGESYDILVTIGNDYKARQETGSSKN
jgi:LCP family protein required for cell wall assembly